MFVSFPDDSYNAFDNLLVGLPVFPTIASLRDLPNERYLYIGTVTDTEKLLQRIDILMNMG